jgi:hypothetical protein
MVQDKEVQWWVDILGDCIKHLGRILLGPED